MGSCWLRAIDVFWDVWAYASVLVGLLLNLISRFYVTSQQPVFITISHLCQGVSKASV